VGHHERVHHVLIADDDRAIRESLARALELEGYAVTVVVDGVEALTHARGTGFDALVLDVMIRRGSGRGRR
jgi:two-component system, OmpR family, response regulator MprA